MQTIGVLVQVILIVVEYDRLGSISVRGQANVAECLALSEPIGVSR